MFKHYTYLYYLSLLFGQIPFFYSISKNEIAFSFPKIKIAFCISAFLIFVSLELLVLYLVCSNYVMYSFMTGSPMIGLFIIWIITNLNNFYYSKEITMVLKEVFELEKMTKSPKMNKLFILHIAQMVFFLTAINLEHLPIFYSEFNLPPKCMVPMHLEYLDYKIVLATYIFVITELRLGIRQWKANFKTDKLLDTSVELEKYLQIYAKIHKTLKLSNKIFAIPVVAFLGGNFLTVLMTFYVFLHKNTFHIESSNIFSIIPRLYSASYWGFSAVVGVFLLVFFIDSVEKELHQFSNLISSEVESINYIGV